MGNELTIGIIFTAAILDSINPCVLGVLIFLVAFMTKLFQNRNKMLLGGIIYTATVYVTYLALGFGILKLALNTSLAGAFYWAVALIAIVAGLLELKDYFWYGKGFTLQMFPGAGQRLEKFTAYIAQTEGKHPAMLYGSLVLIGIFVVLVELPCTGAPYLAILGLLSKGAYASAVPLLLFYNLVFILPLIVIVVMAYLGTASEKLEVWRKEHRGFMRLLVGFFLVALGVYMISTLI
ncbi:MAG: hypothetical protein AAB869_01130 [Patescibacteria group bacterium]